MEDKDYEERDVRVEDPSLSPEANASLTQEVRAVVGSDQVEVPRSTPHFEREAQGSGTPLGASLRSNALVLSVVALAGIVVLIVMLLVSTSSPILVGVAFLGLVVGLAVVVRMAIQMTDKSDAPSARTSAKLEEEGVEDPESAVTRVADQFADNQRGSRDE